MQHRILREVCCLKPFQKHVYILSPYTSPSFPVLHQYHIGTMYEKLKIKYTNTSVSYSRGIHLSSFTFSKEPSKVEETVKVLKEGKKKEGKFATEAAVPASSKVVSSPPKRSIGKRIIDEIIHYYHGFRLLFIDIKVSSRYVWKILHGEQLTRREHRQLVRTVSDLFRLVPFSIFIIIPFMELLLPVFLKLFPAMLPSTFQTKSEKETKRKTRLKMKIEMAKFLQSTLDEMALQAKGDTHSHTAKEFVTFFEKIQKTGEQATNDEIIKFSKLFEDEITLDSLPRPSLIALCRLLELQPIGTNNFLRFQLKMRLRNLKADDQVIVKEGIDGLTIQELQSACRARGMRALGMPENRLRSQLEQWLELSLNEQIPPSLLLLSRALYLPENLPATDKLKVTLSSLPDTAAAEAKLKIGEIEGKVDNKTKLEIIKKEEAEIKKEEDELIEEMLEKEKEAEKKGEILVESKPQADTLAKDILIDKAPHLEDKAESVEKVEEAAEKEELSKEDFADLEDALENVVSEKKELLIEKEEIEGLKEEMADYKQDLEDLQDITFETGQKELKQTKAAVRLSKKVDKMISKMDKFLDDLNKEKEVLQQQIDDKSKEGVNVAEEKDNIISINELVLAMRRIQKVSDDTRLQRIADVLEKMDSDDDGSVEVDHVLKVIKLLGKDNVKISTKQMDEIIELLIKEDSLELEEKIQKQKQMEAENTCQGKTGEKHT